MLFDENLFFTFLQRKDNVFEDLKKVGIGIQLATHVESLQALVLLLQYVQGVCDKNKQDKEKGKLRAEVRKIMHVHDGDKSLMLRILSNKQFFAAHAIVHQIENYIHAGDSIAIQKSINKNMKSSKLSKDTVSSIKKLNPKEKVSVYQMVKSFVDICCARLAFRLLPITSDVVTDSLRLNEINEDLSNISATTNTTNSAQNNSEGLFLKLLLSSTNKYRQQK